MNSAQIWSTLITTVGVVATAVIQAIVAGRKDKLETRITSLESSIKKDMTEMKQALQKDIEDLREDESKEVLARCKSDLVTLMSRIRNGYKPTAEEIMILYETKELYNNKGGDSYVDDMFDGLKKEGLI